MTDRIILQCIYSYLRYTIDPESSRSVDIEDLKTLQVEDLADYKIPDELIEIPQYPKEDIEIMMSQLSKIIIKMEEKNIKNI